VDTLSVQGEKIDLTLEAIEVLIGLELRALIGTERGTGYELPIVVIT
jgi:hypothetical protein